MAAFNYTGFAKFTWPDDSTTVQFVDFNAERRTLSVWPVDSTQTHMEFCGQIQDHPAVNVHFPVQQFTK